METEPKVSHIYQVGGALSADADSYVERQSDEELYNALKNRNFCYVLNSRQMGKSSLVYRTMKKLQKEGITCACIEIRMLCEEGVTPNQWYESFLELLVRRIKLKLDTSLLEWLRNNDNITPLQRFQKFIEDILFKKVSNNIVIFIDEIDSLLSIKFRDDFLAFIRQCYNLRAYNDDYKRLAFALLGVATPSELIQDHRLTPFNIESKGIELNGFTIEESKPLEKGLTNIVNDSEKVLEIVLKWTGGQPFLTQLLCQLIVNYSAHFNSQKDNEEAVIEELVQTHIIQNSFAQDKQDHLNSIHTRLLYGNPLKRLNLYQQIVDGREIVADDSLEQIELRLSGLVIKKQSKLEVFNPIYREIFNRDWVEKELKKLNNDDIGDDEDLAAHKIYASLEYGNFCYVLSLPLKRNEKLIKQIEELLKRNNFLVSTIDSSRIDKRRQSEDFKWKTRGQWYKQVCEIINQDFQLNYSANRWWNKKKPNNENEKLKCLRNYIEEKLFQENQENKFVIILNSIIETAKKDENIDTHLFNKLQFKDEFFAFIRSYYRKRTRSASHQKLHFILLDTAIHLKLDKQESEKLMPLTVAWSIQLNSALEKECDPIIVQGLDKRFKNIDIQTIIKRIWYWTSGHPFLTQKLFEIFLLEESTLQKGQEENYIDNLVKQIILPSTNHYETIF